MGHPAWPKRGKDAGFEPAACHRGHFRGYSDDSQRSHLKKLQGDDLRGHRNAVDVEIGESRRNQDRLFGLTGLIGRILCTGPDDAKAGL